MVLNSKFKKIHSTFDIFSKHVIIDIPFRNQLVIRGEFFDSVDVGTIREVEILPDRIVQGNRRWMLNQVLWRDPTF